MKIGPVDVSPLMLGYAGAIVGALLLVSSLWAGGKTTRAEAWYRESILTAVREESVDAVSAGIDACNNLIAMKPDRPAPHLFLASLLMKQKKFGEAQKEFEKTGALPSASPEEKAWAFAGAAAAAFQGASAEERKAGAAAAEGFAAKALEADKDNPDALAAQALARSWSDAAAVPELLQICERAVNAEKCATPRVAEQLYLLRGRLLSAQGKPLDALADAERALMLHPEWPEAAEARRMMLVTAVQQKDLDLATRRELLEKTEKEVNAFGPNQFLAFNALGLGWSMCRDASDYATGPWVAAQRNFRAAVDRFAKEPLGYVNLAALYEARVGELSSKLATPVTGLNGESPASNPWVDGPARQISDADKKLLNEIQTLLKDQDALWQAMIEKSAPKPDGLVNAKLRQLACIRRVIWLPGIDANQRKREADRVQNLARELAEADPNNPMVLYVLGLVYLERGDNALALKTLESARTKGCAAPGLEKLIADLSGKAGITDLRPSEGNRTYGSRPLVRATLTGIQPSRLISAKGILDGQPADVVLAGSQVLYLTSDKDSSDGRHTMNVSVSDSAGASIEVPAISFFLDKLKPRCTVDPESTDSCPARPTWKISLSDASGIDFNTLKVRLKTLQGNMHIDREFVKDGKYKDAGTAPGGKPNTPVADDSFQIVFDKDLAPGVYELTIEVTDMAGNSTTDKRKYTVK